MIVQEFPEGWTMCDQCGDEKPFPRAWGFYLTGMDKDFALCRPHFIQLVALIEKEVFGDR